MADVDTQPAVESDAQPDARNDGSPIEGQDSGDLALATTSTEVAAPTEKKVKKIIRRKRRPARPQVDPALFTAEPPQQTGTIFNIWYAKWSGGDRQDSYMSKTQAKGRCNIARDSGYTRADKVPGSYFCLWFARGLCSRGQDCEYLHRLPGVYDVFSPNVDCFGRDKFSDYRDDMGGVGSFMRHNRTIYVGRIHVTDDIEEVVARHFAEWGPIERSEYLPSSKPRHAWRDISTTSILLTRKPQQFEFSIPAASHSSCTPRKSMQNLQRKPWRTNPLTTTRL